VKGDSLGDRMKDYEGVPRTRLTRRVPVMMRLDGKSFHTFTRNLPRPYHRPFHLAMWSTAKYLCEQIQGARLAYVQSDEISILLTDYEAITTEAWFDYQVQKMCSVAAGMASAHFIVAMMVYTNDFDPCLDNGPYPCFDARVWNLPKEEVCNAFIWRQQDATRNAIQMLGQSWIGHKKMQGLNNAQVQERLFQDHGINFNDVPVPQKRGVCIVKEKHHVDVEVPEEAHAAFSCWTTVERTRWVVDENIPIFTQDRSYVERVL
jgi:tRNA(His) guanylyltransferase